MNKWWECFDGNWGYDSWLTAGLAWKHLHFLLSGQLWVLQFPVHIFCWLPVCCTAQRIRGDRKRRGLSNWPLLQTAEKEGQTYWTIQREKREWRVFWAFFSVMTYSLLAVFFFFLLLNLLLGFVLFFLLWLSCSFSQTEAISCFKPNYFLKKSLPILYFIFCITCNNFIMTVCSHDFIML